MAVSATLRALCILRGAITGLLIGTGLVGCGSSKDQPQPGAEPVQPAVAKSAPPDSGVVSATAQAIDARWRRPFAEVTRDASQGEPPPNGCERPPDMTFTGKPTAMILDAVKKTWDSVALVSESGQALVYPVTLDTELGTIDLELHAGWAPNHVRNFVTLARVGYYDGLCFDRIVHQVAPKEIQEDGTIKPTPSLPDVDMIEAGCPLGTGVPGFSSLGYWLKPEFNSQLKNEEGTIGACRLEEEDTAACKFYISLCKAPTLDGYYTVFGKVTQGLDTAARIFREPRIETEEDAGYHRPLKPVVIRKATVHPAVLDKTAPAGDNR